ncbi:uncharacterized protein LOC143245471 [Tachypleus tridentatus]|uniref:uncharacterized protein LOC143245471 n=1 Tax=Tachypleus tridentatus TaxID=6853 RepID=UPI003FCF500C
MTVTIGSFTKGMLRNSVGYTVLTMISLKTHLVTLSNSSGNNVILAPFQSNVETLVTKEYEIITNETQTAFQEVEDNSWNALRVSLSLVFSLFATLGNLTILLTYALGSAKRCNTVNSPSQRNCFPVVDQILIRMSLISCGRAVLTRGPIQAFCLSWGGWTFGDAFCQIQGYVDMLCRHLFFWLMALLGVERYRNQLSDVISPQAYRFASWGWTFGDAFCQIQGYVDMLCRHLFFWLMALLGVERYTKHMMPHEHVITFSPLSVKVMIPGIFLLISAQVSSPLYGWGQYGYVQEYGVCDLLLSSPHCCSYSIYTWIILIIPPVCVLGFCLGGLIRCSKETYFNHEDIYTRGLLREKSNIFEEDKEIKTIVLSGSLFTVLMLPTWLLATFLSCNIVSTICSWLMFTGHVLDMISGLVLPIVCLTYHSKVRKSVIFLFKNNRYFPFLRANTNTVEQVVATSV